MYSWFFGVIIFLWGLSATSHYGCQGGRQECHVYYVCRDTQVPATCLCTESTSRMKQKSGYLYECEYVKIENI